MSPRRPAKDPLDEARAFADEAERAQEPWRQVLVTTARMKLDEARVGLKDSEGAVRGHADSVAQRMGKTVEKRRAAIAEIAHRLDAIDRRDR